MRTRLVDRSMGNAVLILGGVLALAYVAWYDLAPVLGADQQTSHRAPFASLPKHTAEEPIRCNQVRIGWTAWADAEFVTQLTSHLLRSKFGCKVKQLMTDIGVQYRGIASGELDLMLMAWLPVTHAPYYKSVAGSVTDLGALYTGARLGWAVPDYVPESELSSIEDLGKSIVQKKLRGRIQGIDPGSGLMQASEKALAAYGLSSYELLAGSGAAMTAAVERAARLREWIVVTAWSPHWMFSRWQMRYLTDPKHMLSQHESVHALARKGFARDVPPSVVDFLVRMYIPIDELEDALLYAIEHSTEDAVQRYLREHPARIGYWVTGKLDANTSPGDR